MDDYFELKKLGRGSFADVFLCWHKESNTLVANKRIELTSLDEQGQRNVKQEAEVMAQFKGHSNIVTLIATRELKGQMFHMYLEYCSGGSLEDVLKRRKAESTFFVEHQILVYLHQMATGLAYVHKHKIIHRDMKPANILLTDSGDLKLADFGVCAALASTQGLKNTAIGTLLYMAPEVWKSKAYSYRCDIWSLGILTYELTALRLPFKTDQNSIATLMKRVLTADPVPLPSTYSDKLRHLVAAMLSKDPAKRPTSDDLGRDKFLQNANQYREFERAVLEAQLVQKDNIIKQHEADLNQHRADLNQHEADLNQYEAGLNQHEAGLKQYEADLKQHEADLKQYEAGLNQHEAGLKQYEADLKQYEADLERKDAALEGSQQQLQEWQESLRQLELEHDKCQAEPGERAVPVERRESTPPDGSAGMSHRKSTGLFEASFYGKADLITTLISQQSEDVNRKNEYGWTPLHLACLKDNDAAVDALVQGGADINASTEKACIPFSLFIASKFPVGCTPLHMASRRGNERVIAVLLRHHADKTRKDADGKTPRDVAKNKRIKELLE